MDKDKKREQTRERVKRYREKQKSVTDEALHPDCRAPFGERCNCRLHSRDEVEAANLELCRTCQVNLPPLEQPRKYPGMCFVCSCAKIPAKFGVHSRDTTFDSGGELSIMTEGRVQ